MPSPSASNWRRRRDGALRAPWQVAVFGGTLAVAAVAFGAVGLGLVAGTPVAALARTARIPLDQVASLGAVLVATLVTVRWVAPGTSAWARVGLGLGAWRPVRLAVAALAGTIVVAVPTGLMLWLGAVDIVRAPANDAWAAAAWGAFALLAPAALAEELLCRGFALSAVRDAIGARGAVVATSLAFGALHAFNPGATTASLVAVTVAGLLLGAVRVATDSLAAAWAAHLTINLVQAVAFHAPLSGVDLPAPGYRLESRGPAWLTGGAWGPEGGAAVVVGMLVATFGYTTWRAWRDARAITSGPIP
jgi:membrane protease YdiL (CAAX protease family)